MQIHKTQNTQRKACSLTLGHLLASWRYLSLFFLILIATSHANPIVSTCFDTGSHLPKSSSRRSSRAGSFGTTKSCHLPLRKSLNLERSLILLRGGSSILQDSDKDEKNLNVNADPRPMEESPPRGGFGMERKDGAEEDVGESITITKIAKEKVAHRMNPRLANMIRLLFITYYGSLGALMPFVSADDIIAHFIQTTP